LLDPSITLFDRISQTTPHFLLNIRFQFLINCSGIRIQPISEVTRRVILSRSGKRFRINGKEFDPNRIDIHPRLNLTEIWEVFADIPHPFHLHLAHFQVLSRNNQTPTPTDVRWKDTVRVDPREMV
jgi:FtsP/CotA-like multicopper oxidase with cupredoxin domain